MNNAEYVEYQLSVLCSSVSDLTVWNKSLSQRWRRLRRRCSSFTSSSGSSSGESSSSGNFQNKQLLLEQDAIPRVVPKLNRTSRSPHSNYITNCKDDIDVNANKTANRLPDMQQMLRSKLGKIHSGLRKRRVMSVVEPASDTNLCSFYVPSPLVSDSGPSSLPPYYLHSQTNYQGQQNQFESSFVSNNIHSRIENVPHNFNNNITRNHSNKTNRKFDPKDTNKSNRNHSCSNRSDQRLGMAGQIESFNPYSQRNDDINQPLSLRLSPHRLDSYQNDSQKQYDHGYHSIESQYKNFNSHFKSLTPEHKTSKIASLNQIKRLHNSSSQSKTEDDTKYNKQLSETQSNHPVENREFNNNINFRLGIHVIESNGYGKYKVIEPSKQDRNRRWSQVDDLRIDELTISNDQIPNSRSQAQGNSPVKFQIGGSVSNHIVPRTPLTSSSPTSLSSFSPSSMQSPVESIPEEQVKTRMRNRRSVSPEFRRINKKDINRSLCERKRSANQLRASCDLQTFVQRLEAARSLDKKVRCVSLNISSICILCARTYYIVCIWRTKVYWDISEETSHFRLIL